MDISDSIGILVGLALIVVFLILVWRVLARRSSRPMDMPESLQQVAEARIEEGEQAAALVSEQIEEMVRQKLAGYGDLAQVKLDFATAADGSLEIWVDGERFADASHIPDQRIRDAITESVATFNR